MMRFAVGERVRVDIPDETDPDYAYHGLHGTVEYVLTDDAGKMTGDPRDDTLYCVSLDAGETIDLRWRDLRPPNE